MNAIANYNRDLVALDIRGCWRVSDTGIAMIAEYCQNLKVLKIADCRYVDYFNCDVKNNFQILFQGCDGSQLEPVKTIGCPNRPNHESHVPCTNASRSANAASKRGSRTSRLGFKIASLILLNISLLPIFHCTYILAYQQHR